MSIFKKGVMRKEWSNAKDKAIKAAKDDKIQITWIKGFKADFGPSLDDLEALYDKRATKVSEYKSAWDEASKLCNQYKLRLERASIEDVSRDTRVLLDNALDRIRELLDSNDVKP
ncbi:MAG TPA: hypothetical protein VGE52_06095 [Pirellulales bacterium]